MALVFGIPRKGARKMKKNSVLIILVVIIVGILLSSTAGAALFGNIVAFGDSLTDNGNLYLATEATGAIPPAPSYSNGRFSNGPVWVEYLATFVSNNQLEDYAYGGAVTGADGTVPGLLSQVGAYASQSGASDKTDTLFTVWAGPNDFFNALGTTTLDFTSVAQSAVNNIIIALEMLEQSGAAQILIPNMPDLGKTPAFNGTDVSMFLSDLVLQFNTLLDNALTNFERNPTDTHLYRLDVYSLFSGLEVGDYGLQNITEQGLDPSDVLGSYIAADDYLFWDGVHPTSQGHLILASEAYNELTAPVPIPGALWCFASGLVGLLVLRKGGLTVHNRKG
jgi:phospholipase/lecithinase/hemolysin